MLCPTSNGRLVPKPEVAASFNHIVCQGKHLCWDSEAERLGRLEMVIKPDAVRARRYIP
jgi:hypothetical protein